METKTAVKSMIIVLAAAISQLNLQVLDRERKRLKISFYRSRELVYDDPLDAITTYYYLR